MSDSRGESGRRGAVRARGRRRMKPAITAPMTAVAASSSTAATGRRSSPGRTRCSRSAPSAESSSAAVAPGLRRRSTRSLRRRAWSSPTFRTTCSAPRRGEPRVAVPRRGLLDQFQTPVRRGDLHRVGGVDAHALGWGEGLGALHAGGATRPMINSAILREACRSSRRPT